MAGIIVTQQDLHVTSGSISLDMQKIARRIVVFKEFLDAFSAQDLVDKFGLSIDDANLIKSGVGELYMVAQTQAQNHTFSTRLAGMGDVF